MVTESRLLSSYPHIKIGLYNRIRVFMQILQRRKNAATLIAARGDFIAMTSNCHLGASLKKTGGY